MPSTQELSAHQHDGERAAGARQSFQSNISEKVNKMRASVDGRQAQTEATIEEWKRKREVNKLDNRARDLEEYAEVATTVLNLAQEESHQASLDAIEARRLAEEARVAATPA